MTTGPVRVAPQWLALRESADAAARSGELVDRLREHLPAGTPMVVHDLGCGTGSMGRWLAPRLPGPQHWILYDRDPDLLAHAAVRMPAAPNRHADPDQHTGPTEHADSDRHAGPAGAGVRVSTRQRDITRLGPDELAGASLITASALLDMLTAEELARFVAACAGAGCPVLITLSVTGRVELRPDEVLDGPVGDAFNEHQRRVRDGRRLLGPDAVGAAVEAFHRLGTEVLVRPSPWRLGTGQAALAAEWFSGWVAAACEQRPELTGAVAGYAGHRLAEAAAGRLGVTVHHDDLLVLHR